MMIYEDSFIIYAAERNVQILCQYDIICAFPLGKEIKHRRTENQRLKGTKRRRVGEKLHDLKPTKSNQKQRYSEYLFKTAEKGIKISKLSLSYQRLCDGLPHVPKYNIRMHQHWVSGSAHN